RDVATVLALRTQPDQSRFADRVAELSVSPCARDTKNRYSSRGSVMQRRDVGRRQLVGVVVAEVTAHVIDDAGDLGVVQMHHDERLEAGHLRLRSEMR